MQEVWCCRSSWNCAWTAKAQPGSGCRILEQDLAAKVWLQIWLPKSGARSGWNSLAAEEDALGWSRSGLGAGAAAERREKHIVRRGVRWHCAWHSSVKCVVCSVHCVVYSVQCAGGSVCCAVYSVQWAVCSVQFAVCSLQFAMCSVQCALCRVQCAVCSVRCAVFLHYSVSGYT